MRYGRKYFCNVFPRLAVSEIRYVGFNESNYGTSCFGKLKQFLSERTPFVIRFVVERILRKRVDRSGGVLGKARMDVRSLANKISERFPSCKQRLSDLSDVSSNAAFSLKGLAVEAGLE